MGSAGEEHIDIGCCPLLLGRDLYMPGITLPAERQTPAPIIYDAVDMQRLLQVQLHGRLPVAHYFVGNAVDATGGFRTGIRLHGNIITQYIPPGPFGIDGATQSVGMGKSSGLGRLGPSCQGEHNKQEQYAGSIRQNGIFFKDKSALSLSILGY